MNTSENETEDGIPEFCKNSTALFISYITKKSSPVIKAWHRISARMNATTLLHRGYDTLIVDYGSDFGKIALQELISIRQHCQYTLIAVKIAGEKNFYSNRLEEIEALAACDLSLGLIGKSDFLSGLVGCSSAIVNGNQINYHNSCIPQPLFNYIKTI